MSLAIKADVDSIVGMLDVESVDRPGLIQKVFSIIHGKETDDEDKRANLDGLINTWQGPFITVGDIDESIIDIVAIVNPTSRAAQKLSAVLNVLSF